MEKSAISFADRGVPSLLVLSVPDELAAQGVSIRCFAIPILSRRGGLLLNLPRGVVSEDALIDSLHVEDDSGMLGPSKGVSAHLCVEDEEGNIVVRQDSVNSLVIDFSDEVLPLLREYGVVVAEEGDIVPFSVNAPTALPSHTEVCESAVAWIGQTGPERVNFYSAQEDPEEPAVEKAAAEVKSGATKKAPAVKRVTNAQVLDQLSTLLPRSRPYQLDKMPWSPDLQKMHQGHLLETLPMFQQFLPVCQRPLHLCQPLQNMPS